MLFSRYSPPKARTLIGGLLGPAIGLIAFAGTSTAGDIDGCDQFAWPVKREQALFADETLLHVASGTTLASLPERGLTLDLKPHNAASYALPPGRPPESADSFGGTVVIAKLATAGLYQSSASSHGWIDVIQNGVALASVAHSGRRDCPDIRKSVRFELRPGYVTIQISGVEKDHVKLAILPAE